MNWTEIGLVFRKEILDTLRDRRTIMAMIVVPLLVYPIMIVVVSQLGISQVEKIKSSKAKVTVENPSASPELMDALSADSTFTVMTSENPAQDLADRKLDAIITVPVDFKQRIAHFDSVQVSVQVDLSRDRGERMRNRIRLFLLDWRRDMVAERLSQRDLPQAFIQPFAVNIENVAGDRKMGGSIIGRILPFFLVVMMMTGALYPAIDVTAGERERGTLETLLVVPASRFNIVMGKFLTVFTASIVTTVANITSIAFTVFFLVGNAKMGGDVVAKYASILDWRALFLILFVMVPLAILFSGMAMLVASFARSFKEAQNYLSPLMIASMAPAYLSFLPGVEINNVWALVPIANVVLLTRELLLGNYTWVYFFTTVGTMTALALLLLNRTVKFFGDEAMLGGESAPRFSWRNLIRRDPGRRAESLSPGLVAQVFLLVLLGFFYVGTPLQIQDTKGGLALTQIFIIAGIPILALRFWGIPVARTLGLSRIPKLPVFLLVLIGAPAATLTAALVAQAQGTFMEVPASYREMMERLFSAETSTGLLTSLVVFAVIPGICEETLFRGFVLRGLAKKMSPGMAVLWTAVLFGAFHFDLYRLLPTTVLGILMGCLVWLTGSLWPAMLLHVANNAMAVLANNVEYFKNIPWIQEEGAIPMPVLAVVGVLGVLAVLGLWRITGGPGPLDEDSGGDPSGSRPGPAGEPEPSYREG